MGKSLPRAPETLMGIRLPVGNPDNFFLLQTRIELRGTQREYSSKPLKHSIVKRILVFKR